MYLQAVVAQDLRKQFLLGRYFDILCGALNSENPSEPELPVAAIPDPLLCEQRLTS